MPKVFLQTNFLIMNSQQETSIKELAKKYNINLTGTPPYCLNTRMMIEKHNSTPENLHISRLNIFDPNSKLQFKESKIKPYFYQDNYEIAELIRLLFDSIQAESELKIATTIKGIKREVSLNNFSSIKRELWMFANTFLEYKQDGLYQFEFDIPFKEDLQEVDDCCLIKNYTEPYSETELSQIIEYEKEKIQNIEKSSKNRLAFKIQRIVDHYREEHIFDTTKKTIATNEACFLYDALDVLGAIQADQSANNQDKYEYIKKELRK